MQRLEKKMSALMGLGLVGVLASQASAIPLYDSQGFESAAGYVSGSSIVGQPTSPTPSQQWTGVAFAGSGTSTPNSGVFTYPNLQPTDTNRQFATISSSSVDVNGFGFFYPQANVAGVGTPYVPATGESISIRFSMFAYAGYTGNGFVGVSASNSSGGEVGSIGINSTTGAFALPANATVVVPFTATLGTPTSTFNYQMVLDYTLQQVRYYTAPNGSLTYTLNAFSPFQSASTDFSDADLATFALGNTSFSNYAQFDDYSVVTVVPEPASLAAVGLASGLLMARRRRAV